MENNENKPVVTPSGEPPLSEPPSAATPSGASPSVATPPVTTSTASMLALILGILSLSCCGFFTGIPAIFLGRAEIKAADEGRIHSSNRTLAKIGMVLGIVSTVLSCLGTLFYFLILFFGLGASVLKGHFSP